MLKNRCINDIVYNEEVTSWMERQMALQEGANRWLHSESESESAQPPEKKKTVWIDQT